MGYIREKYTDFASSPTVETFVKKASTDKYTAKLKGYFVPPSSDYYRIYVRSDDKSLVYFSNTSSPLHKVRYNDNDDDDDDDNDNIGVPVGRSV